MILLLSPDPADGGQAKPDAAKPPDIDPQAAPPSSPAAVKRTPLKTPREIELEKKLSAVEDKLSGLEGWQKEVNDFLESLDKPLPISIAKPSDDKKPDRKGFWREVAEDLGLEA